MARASFSLTHGGNYGQTDCNEGLDNQHGVGVSRKNWLQLNALMFPSGFRV